MTDRQAALRGVAANHRNWFRGTARARGGSVQRIAGVELAVERPWGNVFPARPIRSAPPLDELLARARELGVDRMSCWSARPDRVLGALLLARGFEWGWQPHWMALDLDQIPAEELEHEVVPFRPGRDDPELPYAMGIEPAGARHLSVRVRNRTVGHVVVNPWRGSAGIYNMGVAERYRRRGIARAVTIAACRVGRELGCHQALLNATADGEPLYRTVGFESLGFGQTWWLHPGRRPTPRQTALVEAIGIGGADAFAALGPTRAELERPVPGAGPPLLIAVLTGRPEVAEWILERRPDLVGQRFDPFGATLLHLAIERDDEALARVALAHGADPAARDRTFNSPAAGWAAHFERAWLAALLA